MRTLTYAVLLLAGSLSSGARAADVRFVAADQSVATRLCMSAITDSRLEFKQQVRDSRIRINQLANKLYCNDVPVAAFAYQAGNDRVYRHLSQYIKGHVDIQDLALVPAGGVILVRGAR